MHPDDNAFGIDERRLVKRLTRGDEEAFDQFSATYLPALLRFARSRLRDPELARDMMQATVVKILPKLGAFRFESSLFSWLCACCRNEIAMHFRAQARRPRAIGLEELSEPRTEAALASPPEIEKALEEADNTEIVHLTLDLLPDHYSRALSWKYFDGLSVAQIASRLELSPKAAESTLTRARRAFLGSFEKLSRDASLTATEKQRRGDPSRSTVPAPTRRNP